MEPPHLTWTFFWFCFCAGMEVSHAECRGCNDSIALILTTKTATFSSDPTCNMTEGNNSGIGSINDLTPGTTYVINLTCLDCCVNVTTKPGEIPGLTLGAATTSSISLVWNKPEGVVSSYRVRLLGADTKMVKDTSGVIDDLTAGAEYDIKVSAVAEDNVTEGAMSNISVYTMPDQVQNLTVREVTTSSILVDWDEPDGDSLFYKVELGGNVQNTSETSINITGLSAGVSYDIIVTAVAGDRQTMGAGKEVLQYTKPGMIHNPSVTFTTTSINMSWSPPAGQELNYRLTWRNDGKQLIRYTTVESAVFTHLTPGTEYTIKLVAIAGDNRTEGDSFTLIQFTKPEEVTDIIVISGTTDISVTWTPASGGVDSYTVFLKRESLLRNTSHIANTTGAVFEGLTPGVLYCVEVVTETAHLSSSSPSVCNATVPKPPGSITVESQTVDSVNFTWSDPDDMDHNQYNFSVSSFKGSVITRNNWFMLDELQPGTPYNISVVTVGLLEYQSTAVTLTSFTKPEEVTDIIVISGTTDISVTWTPASGGVDSYTVFLKRESLLRNTSHIANTTGAVFEGLTPGVLYCVEVVTETAHLSSSSPSVCNATVPKPPGSITVESQTVDSVNFTWSDPDDMDHNQYNFSVSSFKGSVITRNNWFMLDELQPGTPYNISVVTVGLLEYQSTAVTLTSFTRPEKPANVTVTAGTDTLNISWVLPAGRVDHYVLDVSNEELMYLDSRNTTLAYAHVAGLHPGRLHRITVTSVAGDLSNPSDVYSSATVPTPPASVHISERTNSSLHLEWASPRMMQDAPSVSYFITYKSSSGERQTNTSSNSTVLSELASGTLYNITVQTVGPQNSKSAIVDESSFTLPNPVSNLVACPSNTTAIKAEWSDPQGAQMFYTYLVKTYTSTGTLKMETRDHQVYFNGLEPGTRYRITVETVAAPTSQSGPEETYTFTEPQDVTDVTLIGGTTDMVVSWRLASGRVDSYSVLLKRGTALEHTSRDLSNTTADTTFDGLTPGVLFCVTVVTKSAHLETSSQSVCNATLPNPPGPITVDSQTVSSINFTWTDPDNMNHSQYNFSVSTIRGTVITQNNWFVLDYLQAGTLYSVSVATVGLLAYESTVVTAENYTRPESVSLIGVIGTTTNMSVIWTLASGGVDSYSVLLKRDTQLVENITELSNTTGHALFEGLTPGVLYCMVVLTTRAYMESVSSSVCNATFPNPPGPITLDSQTVSSINFTWTDPDNMNHSQYNFSVSTIRGTFITQNNWFLLDCLQAGTLSSVSVATVGLLAYESTVVTAEKYTRPESVSLIAVIGTTTNMSVIWTLASGGVDSYSVLLKRDTQLVENITDLSNTTGHALFEGLTPGVLYCMVVLTTRAYMESVSSSVCNATFPNPPGPITVDSQTVSSINFTWTDPDNMNHSQYNFSVSTIRGTFITQNNWFLLDCLQAGTLYSVSVATVGLLAYESTVVTAENYTRPESVSLIGVIGTTTNMSVIWTLASGGVDSYSVLLKRDTQLVENITDLSNTTGHALFGGLTPGVLYCMVVLTTRAYMESVSSSVCNATFPNPPGPITLDSQTVSSINFTWTDPDNMNHSQYNFSVSTIRGTFITQNNWFVLDCLQAGTLYSVSVATVGLLAYESTVVTAENYTRPESVSLIGVIGTTTNMSVIWTLASGGVDSYSVLLKRDTQLVENITDLSNTTGHALFEGLTPGVLYCVVVLTTRAYMESVSSSVCNATFPNPPGPITLDSQTVSSINFTWTDPDNMNHSQYNFSVSTIRGTFITQNNWFVLDCLQAGTLYSVSVATVGLLAYESTVVTAENYTRPESVSLIGVIGTTTNMSVIWTLASGGVDSYSVLLKRDTQLVENITDLSNTTGHALFEGLTPGVLYCVVVLTTRAYMESVSSSVCNATFPNPPGPIVLELQTEDSLNFTWSNPNDMAQDQYNFSVSTFKSSLITGNNWLLMDNLQPGTLYSISVKTLGALEYESIIVTAQNYTIPQAVNPSISSEGSNSSVRVSWNTPSGRVDYYSVKLNGLWTDLEAKRVNNDTNTLLFESLPAGMSYRAVVITHSGPVRTSSDLVTNATFPNPPGPIEILSKTTGSLELQWTKPLLMENASFYYKLSIYPPHSPGPALTPGTNYTFSSLVPGTPYNITVATVGAMEFESEPVTIISVTTRPNSVKSPSFTTDEDNITVTWDQPDEYRWSYRYILTWQSPDQFLNASIRVTETEYTIYDLLPGSNYIISVTTETMDGTRGRPKLIDTCTDASPVNNVTISSPNTPNAKIIVTWTKPRGRHREVKISIPKENINQSLSACSQNCSFTISNLRHYTQYNLIMETIGCGKPSRPLYFNPTTGITEPAIPENFKLLALARNLLYNKFSVEINSTLLVSNHGPITHVGVLITDNPADFNSSDIRTCLGKTYKDWSDKKTSTYLATVKERQETAPNRTSDMVIEVGDTSDWNGYHNGFLCGNGKYHFAIVLFTSLSLEGDLVDVQSSLVSITSFYPEVNLPTGPAYLGYAVGVPLGIFCILFIVLIGFIIYSRRSAKKASSDIQIHSLGAKISCAVKVEDFEAYYNKQKADSDCGFAEEFEDLKVVGTSQQKINALSVENKPKNRYNNVLPYDSSRVKLSIISGSSFDDYINADYMPGFNSRKEFIAAQGPLPGTVNDFWRMIWEKNVQTVVMLTRCVEQGKVKCEQYWTEVTKLYANIAVTQTSKVPLDDWTIREFDIKNVKTAETRTIRHFHFTAWPDHGVPESTELLISFRHLVREYMDQYSKHSPAVVHCSAGVGRTGTFIAIDRLVYQIERENVVDIYGIVHDMRLHRPLMVQTEAQYVFLYQCALDVIKSRTGTNVDLIYQNADAFSIYANIGLKRLK